MRTLTPNQKHRRVFLLEAGFDVEAVVARRLENYFLVELEELVVCLVVTEFVDGNCLCAVAVATTTVRGWLRMLVLHC